MSGYVLRSIESDAEAGQTVPWRLHQNYTRDLPGLRYGGSDEAMEFTPARAATPGMVSVP